MCRHRYSGGYQLNSLWGHNGRKGGERGLQEDTLCTPAMHQPQTKPTFSQFSPEVTLSLRGAGRPIPETMDARHEGTESQSTDAMHCIPNIALKVSPKNTKKLLR